MAKWTIKNHNNNSVKEVDVFVQLAGDGVISVERGYRSGTWVVETSDNNPPQFVFIELPNGAGEKNAVNLTNSIVNNIVKVDLITMNDESWSDTDIDGLDQLEEEEILKFLENNSPWELEDLGWKHQDWQWWIWGPIEITNDQGYQKIVIADTNGNMIDFVQ